MIEDMTMRKLAPKSQTAYIHAVKNLAAFLKRFPDTASSVVAKDKWAWCRRARAVSFPGSR